MRVFFQLSGEHSTLPKAEALAVLEASSVDFKVLLSLDQVLVVEADAGNIDGIHERLAMSHGICEFYGACRPALEELIEIARGIDLSGSFAVRVKRIKDYFGEVSTMELESGIGGLLTKKGYKVDLENPENIILGILSSEFVLGRVLYEVDRSQYEARRPHRRPYFRPGVMLPRICRAIVNLTRVKKGEKFIDPFCGTGGFLIEADLVGAKVYGCDVDKEVLEGCKVNLQHHGLTDYHLEAVDARELKEVYPEAFDALAADLPYGISSSTHGSKLEELCSQSMESFFEILKPGGYACVVAPSQVPLKDIAAAAGFNVVEEHLERIHRSLTRRILVLQK
ncbi:MAG: TIGR01177 family methyltransferase [Candidatus Hydrothermarchaeales archaeon]